MVERRVHQDALQGSRVKPGGSIGGCWACHIEIEDADLAREVIKTHILPGKRGELGVKLDQRNVDASDSGGECKPRCSHSGAEVGRALPATPRACGCQQNGIVADPMAMLQLP
jgi:hypothetical protein